MAVPTFTFELQYTDSESLFRISNTTDYVAASTTRGAKAEVLIVSHTSDDEVESFITIDSEPVLSKILYDVNNTADGWYHGELLRFTPWDLSGTTPYVAEVRDIDGVITSYADVVYYSVDGKFYKCISDNTSQLPTATTFFEEITDFTDDELRSNDNLEVGLFDKLFDFRSKVCVKNELYKIVNKSNCLEDITKLQPYLKMRVLLSGAQAKMADNKPDQSERIIRELEKYCKC